MRKPIVGVMGPGSDAKEQDKKNAFEVGKLIAQKGWVLLSGGMKKGVMDEVNKGAKSVNGLTVGIIESKSKQDASEGVDIPIVTNMGSARNYINALSSDVMIACGMSAGTASEVAMALREDINVILLIDNKEGNAFFKNMNPQHTFIVGTPQEAIEQAEKLL